MINSREKGKRIERMVANAMRTFFPDVQRNANAQSQGSDGSDLINTGIFRFEVKGGKSFETSTWTKLQNALMQAIKSKKTQKEIAIVWVRTDNIDKPSSRGLASYAKIFEACEKQSRAPRLEFVAIESNDFKKILTKLQKNEGL